MTTLMELVMLMKKKQKCELSANEIVNIAPGEGQIPVIFTSEPDWEALSFPKDYSTGKNH